MTIVMSDRGIPASFRHMHGFGSHTFSFLNAEGERFWVKFHFRTQQASATSPTPRPPRSSRRTGSPTSVTCTNRSIGATIRSGPCTSR
ncbi:hypothetical protein FB470_005553 [Amycolatopsis thermophila]|uniref:Catalase core domain-containing protein n=1 Tax=Amycolatopsis thermophila TaxID=206084 RepID=A0ABU0F1V1_9PSEU|nr:hypothetical protein [Amycolatopsis thermophila]